MSYFDIRFVFNDWKLPTRSTLNVSSSHMEMIKIIYYYFYYGQDQSTITNDLFSSRESLVTGFDDEMNRSGEQTED